MSSYEYSVIFTISSIRLAVSKFAMKCYQNNDHK